MQPAPALDGNVRAQAAQMIHLRRHELAKQVASEIGPPPKSENASKAEELRVWMERGPEWVDPNNDDAQAAELYSLGFTPDNVLDAMFPKRRRLIRLTRPDIEDQVRFAETMAKAAIAEEQLMIEGGIQQLEQAGISLMGGQFGPPLPESMPSSLDSLDPAA